MRLLGSPEHQKPNRHGKRPYTAKVLTAKKEEPKERPKKEEAKPDFTHDSNGTRTGQYLAVRKTGEIKR